MRIVKNYGWWDSPWKVPWTVILWVGNIRDLSEIPVLWGRHISFRWILGELSQYQNYLTEEQWRDSAETDGHIYWSHSLVWIYGEDVRWPTCRSLPGSRPESAEMGGYPEIHTVDEYFDLIERYVAKRTCNGDGTPNIPFGMSLCDDYGFLSGKYSGQFLDDTKWRKLHGSDTLRCVYDYKYTDTAKWYFKSWMRNITKDILGAEVIYRDPRRDYLENYPRVRFQVCRISGGSSTIRFKNAYDE